LSTNQNIAQYGSKANLGTRLKATLISQSGWILEIAQYAKQLLETKKVARNIRNYQHVADQFVKSPKLIRIVRMLAVCGAIQRYRYYLTVRYIGFFFNRVTAQSELIAGPLFKNLTKGGRRDVYNLMSPNCHQK